MQGFVEKAIALSKESDDCLFRRSAWQVQNSFRPGEVNLR